MSKLKVLQVVGQLTLGGQEMMVINFYRHINKEKLDFDFLVYGDKIGELEDEAKKIGGRVIHTPSLKDVGYFKFVKNIKREISENGPYEAIHCHTSFNSGLIIKIAKEMNIPVRITHSHTTKPGKNITYLFRQYSKLMRRLILKNSTHLLACGDEAGEYLYGEEEFKRYGKVLKNGIDLRKCWFNNDIRSKYREEFNINSKLVIGHVGRLSIEKNHKFLLEIFKSIHKLDNTAILVIVGDGQLKYELKKLVKEYGLDNNVIFTGKRRDICEIMQMMDIFIFPSIYEGLPVSIVEAQASGLPCIVSSNVTEQIKLTDLVEFISLDKSPEEWAEVVINREYSERREFSKGMIKSGYDIKTICEELEKIYCEELLNEN